MYKRARKSLIREKMDELEIALQKLELRTAVLEPSAKQRREMMRLMSDYADWFIDGLDRRKTFSQGLEPNEADLKVEGPQSIEAIVDTYKKEVNEPGVNTASGGIMGYVPNGGIFSAAIGDFMAAVSNEFAGQYFASPGAATIENELLNWMKSIFGYPESSIGNLTSGASTGTLMALLAARNRHNVKGRLLERSVVYMTAHGHVCLQKSLKIIGLEDVRIRHVAMNDRFQMNPQDLKSSVESDLENGLYPFLVAATAGTTDCGAIDPLGDIGAVARRFNMWYHVDGAYGGFFALTDSAKRKFAGIETSNSLVVDPHKSLFVPFGLGAVLIRDETSLIACDQYYTANYFQDQILHDKILDPAEISPETTKHFRGLRLWIPLKMHGIEPFKNALEEKLLLIHYFRAKLTLSGFRVGPDPDLSISYFWYESQRCDRNSFTMALMANIHRDGEHFLSSTKINGNDVIRIAVLSFRTKKRTIDKCLEMIQRCLQKTKIEMNE